MAGTNENTTGGMMPNRTLHRPSRRVVFSTLFTTLAVATVGLFTNLTAAHADTVLYSRDLVNISGNIPLDANPNSPGCDHVPGVTRQGHAWANFHSSNYVSLGVDFETHYRKSVAIAMTAFKDLYGAQETCQMLYTFENKSTFNTLGYIGCGAGVPAALKPTHWCAAAALVGSAQDPMIAINLDDCRTPQWNHGSWGGEPQVATWHNQDVKVRTIDLQKEGGFGWLPGHFNSDVYAEDWDILGGVDPTVTGRFAGYGRTPTIADAELSARFEEAAIRATGRNYNTMSVATRESVYGNLISSNSTENINLWPDVPSKSRVETVRVRDFADRLFEKECALSPWIADAVNDGPLSPKGLQREPVITVKNGQECDNGVREALLLPGTDYNPTARAIGQMFVALQAVDGPVSKQVRDNADHIGPLLFTLYANTDTVNHMVARDGDPTKTTNDDGTPYVFCTDQQDFGVSRGRDYTGAIQTDGNNAHGKDPHFANFINAGP